MIQKINLLPSVGLKGFRLNKENEKTQLNNIAQIKDTKNEDYNKNSYPMFSDYIKTYNQNYGIAFGAKVKTPVKDNKIVEFEENLTARAAYVYKSAQNIARKYNHSTLEPIHFLRAFTSMLIETVEKMENGDLDAVNENYYTSPEIMKDRFGDDIFSDDKKRLVLKSALEKESEILDEKLTKMPKSKKKVSRVNINKSYLNDILIEFKKNNTPDADGITGGTGFIEDAYLLSKVLWPVDEKVKETLAKPFILNLSEELMKYRKDKPIPMKFYEDKSREIWRNLNVGTNMFVLYEKGMETNYMIDTFESLLKDKNETFGKFNVNNTKIMRYNRWANSDLVVEDIKKAVKDKDNNYIYVFHYQDMIDNDSDSIGLQGIEKYFTEKDKYQNIKFVMLAQKDTYYDNIIKDKDYKEFSQVTMPVINSENAKKIFRTQKDLMSDIKKDFSQKAIDKAVEAADKLDGYYPEKAQRAMGFISRYYVDKKEIHAKDVVDYVKQAKEIFKSADDEESSVRVIFDTELRLKDIIGLKTTQKEAASIIRQIKDKSIGTKGFIIYSQDGSSGSGRNYTARAIAGETKVPFLEINAVDFGTKDVNLFDESSSSSPEGAMKKLFSKAKAQADINPKKALILFIQNFEYFSCGDQITEYHEKAMSQLLKEMSAAQKQGLNIVVMGSVSNPDFIGESTKKSFKFIDKIEIESPKNNKTARKEIIKHFIKKNNIKLDVNYNIEDDKKNLIGTTAELTENGYLLPIKQKVALEKDELIDTFADITYGHSLLSLMTLIGKFKNVAKERGHKLATKGDFIEAYMQLQCGRPSVNESQMFSKEITTSHECGHAITGTVMNELTKSINPWSESNKVSFITLDPRSNYLAAVYESFPDNHEYTFERVFSDIVASFGGYSCENKFYGIDGSYGISADMENATNVATTMAGVMGIGHYFGKKSVEGAFFMDESDKIKMNKDIDVFLKNAQLISDMIVDEYQDFIKQFTKKYAINVGTGDSIIPGNIFRQELADWRNSLPEHKQQDLMALNELIKEIMAKTQKGILCTSEVSEQNKPNIVFIQ